MAILLTSLNVATFRRGRRLSAAHKQRISQSLRNKRQGRTRRRSNGLIPFDNKAHRYAYENMGGKAVVKDIASKNPRMDTRTADNYHREAARTSLLASQGRYDEANRELDRVNRKYDRYFGQ